jgi:hypothetical protein
MRAAIAASRRRSCDADHVGSKPRDVEFSNRAPHLISSRACDPLRTEMIMHALKQLTRLSVVSTSILAATAGLAAAENGTCGMFKYHAPHTGKCVDARDKPSGKTWADEMLAKKWGS